MFFELDNPWLWVSAFLALVVLAANVAGAFARGRAAKMIAIAALPLHLMLIVSMLIGGAELILTVTVIMVSLLAYTAARYVKIEYEKRREEER